MKTRHSDLITHTSMSRKPITNDYDDTPRQLTDQVLSEVDDDDPEDDDPVPASASFFTIGDGPSSVEASTQQAPVSSLPKTPWNHFDELRHKEKENRESETSKEAQVVSIYDSSLERTVDLRHIAVFGPWTNKGQPDPDIRVPLAIEMAAYHFNHRQNDVVRELGSSKYIYRNVCPIRITTEYFDSYNNQFKAASSLTHDILPRLRPLDEEHEDRNKPAPTFLIGPKSGSVTSTLALLAGASNLPQIGYGSISPVLDNLDRFQLFGRLALSGTRKAQSAAQFFAEVVGATHVAVWYQKDSIGVIIRHHFVDTATRLTTAEGVPLKVHSIGIRNVGDSAEVARGMVELRELGYNHVMFVVPHKEIGPLMGVAYEFGVAGPGKLWMFSGLTQLKFDPPLPADSPIVKAINGTATVSMALASNVLKGRRRGFDSFMRHWRSAIEGEDNEELAAYLQSKRPPHIPPEAWNISNIPSDFIPAYYPYVAYECLMAAGVASCDANAEYGRNFTGPQAHKAFLDIDFEGVYGRIAIDKKTGSRRLGTMPLSMNNIIAVPHEDGTATFDFRTTHTWVNMAISTPFDKSASMDDTEESGNDNDAMLVNHFPHSPTPILVWKPVENSEMVFRYAGGTTIAPKSLPAIEQNFNLISPPVRIFGFALCGCLLLLCLALAEWTYRNRHTRTMKASQPCFMFMLIGGATFMALSLIPQALQEHVDGDTNELVTPTHTLHAACVATPWLFGVGFVLAFSALFSKLARVNRIFHRRSSYERVVVRGKDVLAPFFAIFTANFLVLVVWTAVAPPQYMRVYLNDVTDKYERSIESYGTCFPPVEATLDHNKPWWKESLFYISLLAIIDSICIVWANVQAFRARSISEEYSESRQIGTSMASILQAFLLTCPIMVLFREAPELSYIVEVSFTSILCVAMLLPIFRQKFTALAQEFKQLKSADRVSSLGNSGITTVHVRRLSGSTVNNSHTRQMSVVSNTHEVESFKRPSFLGWMVNVGKDSYRHVPLESTSEAV